MFGVVGVLLVNKRMKSIIKILYTFLKEKFLGIMHVAYTLVKNKIYDIIYPLYESGQLTVCYLFSRNWNLFIKLNSYHLQIVHCNIFYTIYCVFDSKERKQRDIDIIVAFIIQKLLNHPKVIADIKRKMDNVVRYSGKEVDMHQVQVILYEKQDELYNFIWMLLNQGNSIEQVVTLVELVFPSHEIEEEDEEEIE